MKNDMKRYKVLAVVAVLLVISSSLIFIQGTSDDSEASSDSWTCTMTINGNTITTKYAKNGAALSDTTPVSGNNGNATVGSWGFDSRTGYGPFGSFYAAFDVNTGKIAYHLNPNDLSKALDGTSISATGYNIMWVLPTVWMTVGNNTLTMSSEKISGATAPGHTIDGVVYDYLALGVYEAYDDGSKLYSYPDKSPSTSVSLANFQNHARNIGVYGGHSMVWNFYQYQLYRFCSLAVMENFDSQAQIGYGNMFGSVSNTGTTSDKGPYYGTTSSSATGERLFIENMWGNVFDYVGDTYWNYGLYAGQNSVQKVKTRDGLTLTNVKDGLGSWGHFYGTNPDSKNLDSWGLPTSNDRHSSTAPDRFETSGSKTALIVGDSIEDYASSGKDAGISYMSGASTNGNYIGGTRLAMVFDADPTAKLSIYYNVGDGSPQIETGKVLKGQEYTISSTQPQNKGFIFIGWTDGANVYKPGDKITLKENSDITLTAVWVSNKPITPGEDSGPNVPGKNIR